MDAENVIELLADEEIKPGCFIELEVTGEIRNLGKSGSMRIGRMGYRAESGVSARHIMDSSLKPKHGPIEVWALLRGYFEAFDRGEIRLSGNNGLSRIAVYHITRLSHLDAPTLRKHDDIRTFGRSGTDKR